MSCVSAIRKLPRVTGVPWFHVGSHEKNPIGHIQGTDQARAAMAFHRSFEMR